MELSDYLRVLRNHWVGVLLLIVLGVAAAALYTYTQPKVYAANANGFVTTGATSDPAMASVNDSVAKSRAKSYVDIATSRAVAERVIADLRLDTDPSSLIERISVEQPIDTVLLKVTARSSSPREAQQLADAWVVALAEQVDEIENGGKLGNQGIRVEPVEAAALPSSPVSPRRDLNLAIGLALGALLGLAYALIRNQLDRRLRSATALEKAFGVAVVGSIPVAGRLERGKEVAAPLAVADDSDARTAGAAEAFRKLRTNLAFMDVDNPPRVIVVTSPHQGDGKSTIAANLAAAVAISGQPVTLVDGDLRRPTLADSFGLVEGAGLTDALVGRVETADVLQRVHHMPHLSVLAAGGIPPNPSELLGSKSMRSLLEELAVAGMVIIDAPPLLPVTDAAVLTRLCDGALVVVSYGKTVDSELADALGNLETVNARVLGVIFNRVPRRNTASGYYGDYYRSATTPAQIEKAKQVVRTGGARKSR